MSSDVRRLGLILGLLSCIGPLTMDMYLPALPAIADGLGTSVGSVQLTLTTYFIGFGLAQLIYGPLSDHAGRKLPLFIGLSLFVLGTIACALAPTIELLTTARFVQGLGGAVVMVIPRAIIRDVATGVEATRLMGLMMMIVSVSPMLAPLIGSGILVFGGWRAIFVVLGVLAILNLMLVSTSLPETLSDDNKVKFNMSNFIQGARTLLSDGHFMGLTLIGGFSMASFFVFIASASFVYTEQFGLSPVQFGLAFAFNGISFFIATRLAAPISQKIGMQSMVLRATTGFVFFAASLLALLLIGYGGLVVIIALLFLTYACVGLVLPTVMVLALEKHGQIAGLASSLGGTIQMFVGSLMIVVASPFFNGTATPMVGAIAFCSLCAFILSRLVVQPNPADQLSEADV